MAASSPPAIATAIDVFIRPPKNPGAQGRGRGYTMDRKRLFRRGLLRASEPEPLRPTTRIPSCFPYLIGGADATHSGAQGVVQFSNQAFRARLRVRRIALATFLDL